MTKHIPLSTVSKRILISSIRPAPTAFLLFIVAAASSLALWPSGNALAVFFPLLLLLLGLLLLGCRGLNPDRPNLGSSALLPVLAQLPSERFWRALPTVMLLAAAVAGFAATAASLRLLVPGMPLWGCWPARWPPHFRPR